MASNIILISVIAWSLNVVVTWQGFNRIKVINYSNVALAVVLAIWGIVLYPENIAHKTSSNIAGVLFTPLTFVILYLMMSRIYFFLYGFSPEPNIYMTNKGKHTNRQLNLFDHLVILIPTLLSFLIGFEISR